MTTANSDEIHEGGASPGDPVSTQMVSQAPLIMSAKPQTAELVVPEGTHIGRYVVIDRLGTGGMGVVLRAYDPELNRPVALKLVRVEADDEVEREQDRLRLQREAQALAQVNHRHVVAVYDVGTTESGDVFIAMEFVEGQTLKNYCKGKPWRAVVEAYSGVAAGLSACHQKGLVHRDLKPSNVLVEPGGRAVVLDFGLARSSRLPSLGETDMDVMDAHLGFESTTGGDGSVDTHTGEHSRSKTHDLLSSPLTAYGAVVGTPKFMSPEQFTGKTIGAASDQFSFCVALYHSLYGDLPFPGGNVKELRANVLDGYVRGAPKGSQVPGWIRAVVLRGLQAEPGDRWPSMDALLAALHADPTRKRRRWLAVGAVAVTALAGLGWRGYDRAQIVAGCEAEGASIASVWDDARAGSVAAAFAQAGPAFATDAWARAQPIVDAYVHDWQRARTAVCLEGMLHETRTTDMLARSRSCLDERKAMLDGLARQWSRPDETIIQRTVTAASALPRLEACTDPAELARRSPEADDPAIQAASREIRERLAAVAALGHTGHYQAQLEQAEAVLKDAEALGRPDVIVSARLALGNAQFLTDHRKEAAESYEAAFLEADAAGDDARALQAAARLSGIIGYELSRPEEGMLWNRVAEGKRARLGVPEDHLDMAQVHASMASIHLSQGRFEDAVEHNKRALAIREARLGTHHPDFTTSLNNLAIAYMKMKAYDKAVEIHRRSLALREKLLGPEHPQVAAALNNMATAMSQGGDDDVEHLYDRALAIQEKALGPNHYEVAVTKFNIAALRMKQERTDEALEPTLEAFEVLKKSLGPHHPHLGGVAGNIALIYLRQEQYDKAAEYFRKELVIRGKQLGMDHPEMGKVMSDIGAALAGSGEHAQALDEYHRALAIFDKMDTPDHEALVLVLERSAASYRALGALPKAERAEQRLAKVRAESKASAEEADAPDDGVHATGGG